MSILHQAFLHLLGSSCYLRSCLLDINIFYTYTHPPPLRMCIPHHTPGSYTAEKHALYRIESLSTCQLFSCKLCFLESLLTPTPHRRIQPSLLVPSLLLHYPVFPELMSTSSNRVSLLFPATHRTHNNMQQRPSPETPASELLHRLLTLLTVHEHSRIFRAAFLLDPVG